MLKIKVFGKGLVPRIGTLAPIKEPFYADYRAIADILDAPRLTVEYFNPETKKFTKLTKETLKSVSDKYYDKEFEPDVEKADKDTPSEEAHEEDGETGGHSSSHISESSSELDMHPTPTLGSYGDEIASTPGQPSARRDELTEVSSEAEDTSRSASTHYGRNSKDVWIRMYNELTINHYIDLVKAQTRWTEGMKCLAPVKGNNRLLQVYICTTTHTQKGANLDMSKWREPNTEVESRLLWIEGPYPASLPAPKYQPEREYTKDERAIIFQPEIGMWREFKVVAEKAAPNSLTYVSGTGWTFLVDYTIDGSMMDHL